MGAEQSTTQDKSGSQAPVTQSTKACYYDILGIERDASDEEIKKAYRRKALELHPDRNYGNVEDATKQFAEVQSAYQILSDPQERAWYDSHREAILRQDDIGEERTFHNVKLTTAKDILNMIKKFTPTMPFTDSPDGFFGYLDTTFLTLAEEENAAREWEGLDPIAYPSFGIQNASYEEVVRPFYLAWMSFSTSKTFSWKDEYNYADAPDRRVRRLMEKENRRLREDAIREFNDAVRSLVSFVRKRDPRYTQNSQTDLDRQKILRDAAAAQAARSRAAHAARLEDHIVPDWAQSQDPEEADSVDASDESEEQHFECVVCKKTFKSEKQWEAHERSKKHSKAVQQLQKQMRKENKGLDLHGLQGSGGVSPPIVDHDHDSVSDAEEITIEREHPPYSPSVVDEKSPGPEVNGENPSQQESGSDEDSVNGEYASRENVESRLSHLASPETNAMSPGNRDVSGTFDKVAAEFDKLGVDSDSRDENGDETGNVNQKIGKAKAKRAKKAARQTTMSQVGNMYICGNCKEQFGSKNKLFKHIEVEGHAQPVTRTGSVPKAKGKTKH